MANNNDILRGFLNRVKNRIISEQQNQGIRLTGESADSLQVERVRSERTGRFEAGAVLTSVAYLPTNFKGIGVRPGIFPPFGSGSKLHQWVVNRGLITVDRNGRLQSTEQTSFLVARKIYQSGTDIYTRGGIDFKQIQEDELPETLKEIATSNAAAIIEQWNKAILK